VHGFGIGKMFGVGKIATNCAARCSWLAWSGSMMKCTVRNWSLFLAASLALTSGAQAGDRATVNRRTGLYELPMTDLRKAAERGDRAELARVAARLGPARIAKALQDPDRRTVLAALDGAALLTSGILLLESISPLLASADEGIRAHAVGTAATLLAASDAARLADFEVAEETAQSICQSLALLAANEAEALPTRLQAVQGLADAPAMCADERKPGALLASREPEMRRAAVVGLLISSTPSETLVAAAQDRDAGVAAAAGARLCERHGQGRPLPVAPPLRQLALAQAALPEDVIGMLPCLVASADPADGKSVEDLQTNGATAVREAIKQLKNKNGSR
jgi:hypothetical protein